MTASRQHRRAEDDHADRQGVPVDFRQQRRPRATAADALQSAIVLAGERHGLASTAELEALDLDADRRRSLSARGLLHARHADVWAVGADVRTPKAELMAAVLAGGDRAVAADLSAAWTWGWRRDPEPIATVAVPRNHRRKRDDVRFREREVPDADRTEQHGIPVTTPARTIVDCAPLLEAAALDRLVNDALISPY